MDSVTDVKGRIDELAALMTEYGLDQAKLKGDDWEIEFSNLAEGQPVAVAAPIASDGPSKPVSRPKPSKPKRDSPKGIPVTSPMTGIYYASPSPGAPAFVKEGDTIVAGQVIALIEAMKVFNEVTAVTGGTVLKVVAENGQLVNPGDILFTLS